MLWAMQLGRLQYTWPKSLLVDRKDGRTDGRTHGLIESLITTDKLYRQGDSIQFIFGVKSPIKCP